MFTRINRLIRSQRTRHIIMMVVALIVATTMVVNFVTPVFGNGRPPQKPEPPAKPAEPLTDVAPPPPLVDVRADEGPQARLERLGLNTLPQTARERQLPQDVMDLANPPQWTETLAAPPEQPVPPDPFQEPPIAVNPERGQPADAPFPPVVEPPGLEVSAVPPVKVEVRQVQVDLDRLQALVAQDFPDSNGFCGQGTQLHN